MGITITIHHYKDPYQATRKMASIFGFKNSIPFDVRISASMNSFFWTGVESGGSAGYGMVFQGDGGDL